ncbi:MAG: toxin-antitoxin system HicB family antitoxin [Rubrobacteraceae bacterium]
MSTLSVRLPESLHKRVKELAESEGVSMNQFIALAVAEKMSALMTVEYLEERAGRGSREKFDAVLEKVAEAEPEEHDRL